MKDKIDMLLEIILELREEVKCFEHEIEKNIESIDYYKNELDKNNIKYR